MQKDRGFRVLAIVAICFAVAGLSLGYAAFNTELNINTDAVLKGVKWNVEFQNLSDAAITGTGVSTSATITSKTQIDLALELTKPGDSVSYTFDVANTGTLDAVLDSVPTLTGLSDDMDDYVTYTLTYSDGGSVNKGDTLIANTGKETLKLTVTYISDVETPVSEEDQTLNLTATLLYVQS